MHISILVHTHSFILLASGAIPQLTLMAVAVSPADGTRALSEEAPRLGLLVWISTVAVVPEASAWVLLHVVWKVSPPQAGKA